MKIILLVSMLLLLVGCGDRPIVVEQCYKGVTIWRVYHGAQVALDTNSKIIPCKEY